MARVSPGGPRAIRSAVPGGIRFAVPVRCNWLALVFTCAWLGGWAYGELTMLDGLHRGDSPAPFAIAWLVGWTAVGAFALWTVAWGLAGREVLTVAGRTLSVRREALGIGLARRYDAARVRNLRVSRSAAADSSVEGPDVPPWRGPRREEATHARGGRGGAGPIAFDYAGRTVRVGSGVEEAEAQLIVAALRERLPQAPGSER